MEDTYRPHIGWHDYSQSEREQEAINAKHEHEDEDTPWPNATHTNRGSW